MQRSFLRFSEDRDDVFDLDHKQAVVALEIDGDGAFGIEQHLVVLAKRYVRRVFNLGRNCYNSAGDCGDFDVVGRYDRLNQAGGLYRCLLELK